METPKLDAGGMLSASDYRRISVSSMARRTFIGLIGASALAILVPARADELLVTVHKDPNCGCCSEWVAHLRDAGFTVRLNEASDLEVVRSRLGVPTDLGACHTAEVDGYAIEGHVPALAIRRLLSERPAAKGLAVPGMPAGSPGMESGQPQPYAVILFGTEGRRPFMNFIGKRAVG